MEIVWLLPKANKSEDISLPINQEVKEGFTMWKLKITLLNEVAMDEVSGCTALSLIGKDSRFIHNVPPYFKASKVSSLQSKQRKAFPRSAIHLCVIIISL